MLGLEWKQGFKYCQDSFSINNLATWCEELTHLKRPWCWERVRAGGEGDDRGWDGWMASPTQWTWVWVNSTSWWWTGRPGVLGSMGLQRVGHNWAAELNWSDSLSFQLCFSHPFSLNLKSNLHSRDQFDRSHSKFLGKEPTGQSLHKHFSPGWMISLKQCCWGHIILTTWLCVIGSFQIISGVRIEKGLNL